MVYELDGNELSNLQVSLRYESCGLVLTVLKFNRSTFTE